MLPEGEFCPDLREACQELRELKYQQYQVLLYEHIIQCVNMQYVNMQYVNMQYVNMQYVNMQCVSM